MRPPKIVPSLDSSTELQHSWPTEVSHEIALSQKSTPTGKRHRSGYAKLAITRGKLGGDLLVRVSERHTKKGEPFDIVLSLGPDASAALAEFIFLHQQEGNVARQGRVYTGRDGE